MPRSAVIWNEFDDRIKFLLVDEDLTKFQDIFINGVADTEETQDVYDELCGKLNYTMYHIDNGTFLYPSVTIQEFQHAIRGGANVVHCGFIP